MTPDAIEQAATRVRRMQEQSRRLVAERPVECYDDTPVPCEPQPLCTSPSRDTER